MNHAARVNFTEATANIEQTEFCVQRILYPDPAVNSEDALFCHGKGVFGFDSQKKHYFVHRGGEICFDTYFNAFPAHLYELNDGELSIEIEGQGEVLVEIVLARHQRSWEKLGRTAITLVAGKRERIDMPKIPLDGVVYIGFVALTNAYIESADYIVTRAPSRDVSLTGVITTFRRNDAVQNSTARLQKYFDANPDMAKVISFLVIDNGGETDTIACDNGRVIKNPNLGGAGGFTRGLKTVVDENLSTHVLFMDDDASFFPESLRRTVSVLRFTSSQNMAISGAMITEAHKWRMWENGATFDQKCSPIDNGRDLRSFGEVLVMSHGQPRHADKKYGGWWYFCFPVSAVKVWPFPFFVRGDDSYFSLANDFDIVTLPGVVAHQEDFFSKQSPLTVYLDFRYHMVHHLTFGDLKLSPKKMVAMMSRYFNRYNNSYHYDSAAVLNLAIKDVLTGESFWAANADMAERRKLIASMSMQEKISAPLKFHGSNLAGHSPRRNRGRFVNFIRKITFNGHILPKSSFYKKGVHFPLDVRAIEHDTYRRPFTVTADIPTSRGYICTFDRKRYFENRKEFKRLLGVLKKDYARLLEQYKDAAPRLTSQDAWSARLTVDEQQ